MRLEDTTSWRVYWGSDHEIDVALYLRDVLALSIAEGQLLPPVEPAVPVRVPPAIDRAAVQAQWPLWWSALLEFRRGRGESRPMRRRGAPAPGDGSPIDLAARHFAPAAARHFADARRPVSSAFHRRQIVAGDRLGQLVRETELELGRRARPFRMSVLEIPVAGRVWLRTAQEQLLVSSRFAEDVPSLEHAMRTLVRSLA
ncbi:hypothetical protein [Amycolatopsis jiangsuensis]|uniref:Uncharacterized protein n=1 Tax=Amycolatopsis jiangsuensis TaxID=1181879 RepID=A0A840IX12_9PSEU|nr:hypothetical protein [Amycolatopsis jiangsuensis]MBB4687331.1 hypothetical protein [Amycolatopsis jiangsuensis]